MSNDGHSPAESETELLSFFFFFFFNRNDFKFTIEFFIELIIILVQILFGNSRNDCYNNSFLRPTIIQYSCDSLDFVCFFDFYNTLDLTGLSSEKVGFLCNFVLMYHDVYDSYATVG